MTLVVLIHDVYDLAIANVLIDNPERQVTEHGVTIAIYVGILLLSVVYCCQGIRFSGYLNVFTGSKSYYSNATIVN